MSAKRRTYKVSDWHGLYRAGWQGEIVPDAFTHPAKYARTLHLHRAWVVEHRGTQYDLAGQPVTNTVERKSFFRRLAEKKGSPRIDWETVLCMEKVS